MPTVWKHESRRRAAEIIPRLLSLSLPAFLVLGFAVHLCVCLIFAAFYYAGGEVCYEHGDEEFTFNLMFWLSVHSFTTVGYGSVYPTCSGGQILVLAEVYSALLISSIVIAVIVSRVLQPAPRVRFSSVALIQDNVVAAEEGHSRGRFLTLRVVRESSYEMRDCVASLTCAVRNREGTGGSMHELECVRRRVPDLHQWAIWHKIDEKSPLHGREDLLVELRVDLRAFDTVSGSEVRVHKRYHSTDVVRGAKFADMVKMMIRESAGVMTVDHSKLDEYELVSPDADDKDGRSSPSLAESSATRLFRTAAKQVRHNMRGVAAFASQPSPSTQPGDVDVAVARA